MRYEHERREEWFAWLLSGEAKAPWDIRTALESVPTIHWLYVEMRLRGRLSGLAGHRVPPVATLPGDAGDPAVGIWKAALFQEEIARRTGWLGREARASLGA